MSRGGAGNKGGRPPKGGGKRRQSGGKPRSGGIPHHGRPRSTRPAAARSKKARKEGLAGRLEEVLDGSVADLTEISWLEVRRGEAVRGGEAPSLELTHHPTLIVRVLDADRPGIYRSDRSSVHEMTDAVRMAMAHSRGNPPLEDAESLLRGEKKKKKKEKEKEAPRKADGGGADGAGARTEGAEVWSGEDGGEDDPGASAASDLFDPAIAALTPESAEELLARWLAPPEAGRDAVELRGRLVWAVTRLAVANSRDHCAALLTTGIHLEVESCEPGPAAGEDEAACFGTAAGAGRTLDALGAERIVARARALARADGGEGGDASALPEEGFAVVLSPEAAASLLALLDERRVFPEGSYPVAEGVAIHRAPSGPAGLPFPLDIAGRPAAERALTEGGTLEIRRRLPGGPDPQSRLARQAPGGPVTPLTHLVLEAGEASREQLLSAAAGGIWVGRLENLRLPFPGHTLFQARAAGLRRIGADGRLGSALSDRTWEDRLDRLLGEVRQVGAESTTLPVDDLLLASTTAPALVVGGVYAEDPGLIGR